MFAGQRKALTDSIRGSVQAFVDAGFQIHDPISPEEVERLAAEWESHRARLHAELVGITRHESEVESPVFLSRAFTEVPVVVAPLSALGSDLLTPDPSANLFFDQLLIADADRLTEPELHTATRHATRWILMGDGTTPSTGPPTPRNGQPTSLTRTGFFPKLWASMHRPTWMYDTGRLIVQLAEAVRTELRTEPLADCPDVELRFADQANGDVILVQVAFPAGFSILDARSLLLKELGEFRLHPWGPKHWHETADRLTLCYPAAETGLRPVGWFGLQPGVREKVTSNGTDVFTAAVQFDRSAGWTRESAEAWLAEHLPMTESVRTAVVPRPVTVPTPDPVRTMAGIAG